MDDEYKYRRVCAATIIRLQDDKRLKASDKWEINSSYEDHRFGVFFVRHLSKEKTVCSWLSGQKVLRGGGRSERCLLATSSAVSASKGGLPAIA